MLPILNDMKKFNAYKTGCANQKVIQTLTFAVKSGRLCHAYLFYGQALSGKKSLARHFAKTILCTANEKPCNVCPSCKKFAAHSHPDYEEIGGNVEKNSFHVQIVRDLKKRAYTVPNDSAFNVFLLCDVDAMTITAANALLKLLEEPPASSVFLLTCTNPSSIPSTIVSRCIPFSVAISDKEQSIQALIDRGYTAAEAEQALQLSAGNAQKAQLLLEDETMKKNAETSIQLCQAIAERDVYAVMTSLSRLEDSKSDGLYVLDLSIVLLMDSVKCRWSPIKASYESATVCSRLSRKLTTKSLLQIIESMQQAQKKLQQNANIKLTFTWLCVQIQSCINA